MNSTIDSQTVELRKLLKPGMTVYTVLRHRSSSGMSRVIDLFVVQKGQPVRISYDAAKVMDRTYDGERNGIKIGGCGMDMGFALVYNLGRKLYPNGFKLRKGNHARNGDTSGFDKDGGYALNQRWL